jgi:acetyl-CoA carboxylase carboxyl transferase subunit alpha
MPYDLRFELSLVELEKKLNGLRCKGNLLDLRDQQEIQELEVEFQHRSEDLCLSLNRSDRIQLTRHRDRPCTADYIKLICDEFFELRGDHRYGDDRAILGGLATFAGQTIMLIGHQRGRDTAEMQERNFGMPHPEGFRKAQRLMRQAEKFGFPVVCLIDTLGAFPDIESEERGQAQAIAENLKLMAMLRVPVVAIIIGVGDRGGALALSLADRVLMSENAIYTVTAPEVDSSLVWYDSAFAVQISEGGQQLTTPDLLELSVIDSIIKEPPGGAHCDHRAAAELLADQLRMTLAELRAIPITELLDRRYIKLCCVGQLSQT